MIRPVFTEIMLFAAPFVFYAVFLWATQSGVMDKQHWPVARLLSLAIIAMVLMIGSFVYFAHFSGVAPGSDYVPAHIDESGKFVPAQTK
jgi:heme/copper-type cytochrome/quinol oxidase subunit 3